MYTSRELYEVHDAADENYDKYLVEKNRRKRAERRLEHARALLIWLWDSGQISELHESDCPEDDTCACERARKLNAIMIDKKY